MRFLVLVALVGCGGVETVGFVVPDGGFAQGGDCIARGHVGRICAYDTSNGTAILAYCQTDGGISPPLGCFVAGTHCADVNDEAACVQN